MTRESFIVQLEKYYGKFTRKYTRDLVYRYLDRHKEPFIRRLFEHLVLTESGQYIPTPNVAVIEKAAKELARQTGDVPAFKLLENRPAESENQEVQGKLLELLGKYDDSPEVQRVLAERRREEREGVEIPGLE